MSDLKLKMIVSGTRRGSNMDVNRVLSIIAIIIAVILLSSELSLKMSVGIGLLVWAILPSYGVKKRVKK